MTDGQTDGHRMTAIAALMHSIARQNIHQVEESCCKVRKKDYRSITSVIDLLSRLSWDSLQRGRRESRLVLFYKLFHQSSIFFRHVAKTFRSNRQPAIFIPLQCRKLTDWYKFSIFVTLHPRLEFTVFVIVIHLPFRSVVLSIES